MSLYIEAPNQFLKTKAEQIAAARVRPTSYMDENLNQIGFQPVLEQEFTVETISIAADRDSFSLKKFTKTPRLDGAKSGKNWIKSGMAVPVYESSNKYIKTDLHVTSVIVEQQEGPQIWGFRANWASNQIYLDERLPENAQEKIAVWADVSSVTSAFNRVAQKHGVTCQQPQWLNGHLPDENPNEKEVTDSYQDVVYYACTGFLSPSEIAEELIQDELYQLNLQGAQIGKTDEYLEKGVPNATKWGVTAQIAPLPGGEEIFTPGSLPQGGEPTPEPTPTPGGGEPPKTPEGEPLFDAKALGISATIAVGLTAILAGLGIRQAIRVNRPEKKRSESGRGQVDVAPPPQPQVKKDRGTVSFPGGRIPPEVWAKWQEENAKSEALAARNGEAQQALSEAERWWNLADKLRERGDVPQNVVDDVEKKALGAASRISRRT